MTRLRYVASLLTLTCCLFAGGCKEGGRFLSQIGDSVNKEGDVGEEMAWHFRRFWRVERRKPGELRNGWQRSYNNEQEHREDMAKDLRKYMKRERGIYPNLDVDEIDARFKRRTGGGHREFPGGVEETRE